MTQSAVRIAPLLLICIAATPVGAGPRGGAPFGGGVHFGAGGGAFAAPHIAAPQAGPHFQQPSFAPRLPTPHFSVPAIPRHIAGSRAVPPAFLVPHNGGSMTAPSAPQAGPYFARPVRQPQS
jgi:hypothetical protein